MYYLEETISGKRTITIEFLAYKRMKVTKSSYTLWSSTEANTQNAFGNLGSSINERCCYFPRL